jgi:hypothetical protein
MPSLCEEDHIVYASVILFQSHRNHLYGQGLRQKSQPGRPAMAQEVRELLRDMWRSNPTWGSPRIVGELRQLGINGATSTVEKDRPRVRKPSSSTVKLLEISGNSR